MSSRVYSFTTHDVAALAAGKSVTAVAGGPATAVERAAHSEAGLPAGGGAAGVPLRDVSFLLLPHYFQSTCLHSRQFDGYRIWGNDIRISSALNDQTFFSGAIIVVPQPRAKRSPKAMLRPDC